MAMETPAMREILFRGRRLDNPELFIQDKGCDRVCEKEWPGGANSAGRRCRAGAG